MFLYVASLLALAAGAALSIPLFSGRWRWLGCALAVVGSGLASLAGLSSLVGGAGWDLVLPWSVPMGSLHLGMDGLTALFVVPIGFIRALAAVYGGGYFRKEPNFRRASGSWFFYNLLVLSMLLAVGARNGLLFLVSWEMMSLSSFFLVMFHREREDVGRAGLTYMVAMHLGTAFLLVMFLFLSAGGGMEFDSFAPAAGTASVIFALAVLGFGTKAGLIPMHVWLPEAHPAAPSHVSAVMSGVMIKTGIYGILRVLTFLGTPLPWWGWSLLLVGAVSGVLGVLFALAQHDLKRLLAYHSVENIGIIALGMGAGILGVVYGSTPIAVLGFSGALFHVVNHAIFKSLLFMGAGSVGRAAGTHQIDRLGGLLQRMPATGSAFLTGSAAICGLPPLNGFVSEFLIFSAGFLAVVSGGPLLPVGTVIISSLALIGGLAAACFTKAFGIVFLGFPRSGDAAAATESNRAMVWPMVVLAALCVTLGLAAPWVRFLLEPAVSVLLPDPSGAGLLGPVVAALWGISAVGAALIILTLALFWLRDRVLAGRIVRVSETWGCGYLAPTARMQYTASSFAQPTVNMFRMFLRPKQTVKEPDGLLPESASLHTHTDDLFRERLYVPVFTGVKRAASLLRWLHQGQTHFYVLYIALTALVLLTWRLW
ncbi:hydrogenase [bacterium]|nr:hydrogenase [bacterium]